MTQHYRAVVIGGGIVGTAILYHLAKYGWTDVALIERAELTAGSTWHAAAGFHVLNDNPNVAALQSYTINLYKDVEAESGQSVGMHMIGGMSLATTTARFEMLKAEKSRFDVMGMDTRIIGPDEIRALCPIVDTTGVIGALYDHQEGYLDPHGTTHAFAIAARNRGAKVILRNRVVELHPTADGWRLVTEAGEITCDHVINAAGLWARKVGQMVGLNLPVMPMSHHYLVTEDIPELAAFQGEIACVTDLEGFTYMQPERKGILLGVYEREPQHWMPEGAPWDYGMDLLPPDLDRIMPELSIGFERFPCLRDTGIRKWVNGAFTFTPDGNPLVGPVPGLRNYWVACGCMGGFSQGGAIGKVLANWMIHGDPGGDIFGMDIARYGAFASNEDYLRAKTAQFYARRFVISYPNEELPAGRPMKTSPSHDILAAEGAVFGVTHAMETPQYFVPGGEAFTEIPTLHRPNAGRFVEAEVKAVRQAVGVFDSSVYARYEVSGPGAEAWLDRLVASRLPAVGKVRLAPMLGHNGKLMGDLTVSRLEKDRFWLVGSYYLQEWHMRWFAGFLPAAGVTVTNLSDTWTGFAISGPNSRQMMERLTDEDMSNAAFGFLACRDMKVAEAKAMVARISLTGELGYEINVKAPDHRAVYLAFREAGRDLGLAPIGNRALDSLRLEKSYGIWSAEFTQDDRADEVGLGRHVDQGKADFIGRAAVLAAGPATRRLVSFAVDSADADAAPFTAVRKAGKVVGHVTSGVYGYHLKQSLAMAMVNAEALENPEGITVDVIGEPCPARLLTEPAYDQKGLRLRG
ncbi:MAG: FAD-dependent oxidoreductase [Alphaproteobacteria bacterium]|nr:FAD-dependent oxidoreductase [Alphaproteobacteria bacterium]